MKTLLALGCSFTNENWFSKIHPEIDCSFPKWPAIVGDKLGYNVINLSTNGNSNDAIFKTCQDYLVNNKVDMVCVLWTQSTRLNVHDMNNINWGVSDDKDRKRQFKIFNIDNFERIVKDKENIMKLANEQLRNIYMLDQLCTYKNIPAYHMQGCKSFIPDDDEGWEKRHRNYYNAFIHSKYFKILENSSERIWGWPFYKELGGVSITDYFYYNGKQDYIISEKDSHPNAKGQQTIADKFMEIIK